MKGKIALACCVGLLSACGLLPQKVAMNDPRLKPFLEAVKKVDRRSMGFTPLQTNDDVRLESAHFFEKTKYDVMLHIQGRTSRTIMFRRDRSGYRWTGEQEIHEGPRQYTTVDGTFYEQIVITFETERNAALKANELEVDYLGENPKLEDRHHALTLVDVLPIVQVWDQSKKAHE